MEIRLATPQDAGAVQAIYAPVVVGAPTSFELEPPSAAAMAVRIAECLPAYPWLVAAVGDGLAGYAYANRFATRAAYRWSVETTVYIAEASRRQGVGSALYASLLDVLRRQGFRQALAGITLPNPASVALHEAAGYRPAGRYQQVGWKMGAWRDVGWWQCDLGGEDPPGEPLRVDELPPALLASALARGARDL